MAKRWRHCCTVPRASPSAAAMAVLDAPAAARSTIAARRAACWELVRARTIRSNSLRSSGLKTIGQA